MAIIGRHEDRIQVEVDGVKDFDHERRDNNRLLNDFDPNHMLMRAAPELACVVGSLGMAMYASYAEHNYVETSAFVLSMFLFMGKAVCKSLRD